MSCKYYLILFYSISYLLFALLLWLSKAKQGLRLFDDKGLVSNPAMLVVLHIGGIILFGFVPFIFDHSYSFVLYRSDTMDNPSTWVTLLLFILLLFVSPRIAEKKYGKSAANFRADAFPEIKFILVYFIIRILFICVYESWFRGYLLNDSIISLGPALAILLNVTLYSLLHIVNGRDEVIACIPFGILLCCLCIWQGAVWPAIFIHLALTVPYEIRFLRKNNIDNSKRYENFNNRSLRIPG
ncbi:MAG: CPBP family intramembrane glutamic endopeptidase [Ferruginibacter sp.]